MLKTETEINIKCDYRLLFNYFLSLAYFEGLISLIRSNWWQVFVCIGLLMNDI